MHMVHCFTLCSLCKIPLCIIIISVVVIKANIVFITVIIDIIFIIYYYYYYYNYYYYYYYNYHYYYYYYLSYNGYTPPGVLSYWLFRNDVQQLGSHVRVDEYTRSCHKLCYKYNVT